MPKTSQARLAQSKPVLIGAEPQLFVSDIRAACAFFTGRLGFAVAFIYGDPPFYAQVNRDSARINLRHMDQPVFVPGVREREALLSAAIPVDDVNGLFEEFQAGGVTFHQEPRNEPWGARTFIVSDPDGNLLLFAGDRNLRAGSRAAARRSP